MRRNLIFRSVGGKFLMSILWRKNFTISIFLFSSPRTQFFLIFDFLKILGSIPDYNRNNIGHIIQQTPWLWKRLYMKWIIFLWLHQDRRYVLFISWGRQDEKQVGADLGQAQTGNSYWVGVLLHVRRIKWKSVGPIGPSLPQPPYLTSLRKLQYTSTRTNVAHASIVAHTTKHNGARTYVFA